MRIFRSQSPALHINDLNFLNIAAADYLQLIRFDEYGKNAITFNFKMLLSSQIIFNGKDNKTAIILLF